MNILVIGRVPPPVGGVTTFVLRYIGKERQRGNTVTLFPSFSYSDLIIISKIFLHRFDLYQLNSISLPLLILLFVSFNSKKVEFVDHNHSRHFKSNVKTRLKLYFLGYIGRIYLVSKSLESNYPTSFNRFDVLNPFLPPTEDEKLRAKENLPIEIEKFVESKDKLLIVSAWRFVIENGRDLYGLSETIKIFSNTKCLNKSLGLIICIGDSSFNEFELHSLVQEAEGIENIVFWFNCEASWCLFSKNTVYIRPTLTDGDSISVHEALHFNSKVLASDVVQRPKGCQIYEYGNLVDFQIKINSILENEQ